MSKRPKKHKQGSPGGQQGHGMSGEEEQLWSYVTRDASPLRAKANGRILLHGPSRQDDGEDFAELLGIPPRPVHTEQVKHSAPACGNSSNSGNSSIRGGQVKSTPTAGTGFDKRKVRKIARGQIEIDARIDLHGMRQREAHSALRRFLFNAHAKGHHIVLVITGKGSFQRSSQDDYDMEFYGLSDEPGVLRRNVPLWICEGDLNAVVAAYTTAHSRHGGDGALYIHLRKRKLPRPR